MHVVDDVHSFVVHACHFFQYFLIVGKHFFKVQYITAQCRNVFHHQCTGVFTASAVDSQQQCLSQVTACTEELDVTADILIRYTASDTVVVRVTYFTHQVVVLVLDRRCIDRNLCTEVLETFRQFRTPQHGQIRFW